MPLITSQVRSYTVCNSVRFIFVLFFFFILFSFLCVEIAHEILTQDFLLQIISHNHLTWNQNSLLMKFEILGHALVGYQMISQLISNVHSWNNRIVEFYYM